MIGIIIGESPAIHELNQMIRRVAATKTNILVIGESGTGKELVARKIHESGALKDFPFVPVNCGAIPENLIESEMFGHQKGSFTGAVSEKQGLFEVAHRGTLFLDEVGELSLAMQVKLLRAIQERVFKRVGGITDIRVDVRIIAATNRDLEAAVKNGTFREDLYYRLNVILIKTPPLRERKTDIPLLAHHFLKKLIAKTSKTIDGFDDEALTSIQNYSWPGNVRELENCIDRAITLESGSKISEDSLPPRVQEASQILTNSKAGQQGQDKGDKKEIRLPYPDFSKGPLNLDEVLSSVEKIYVEAVLHYTDGNKKKSADLLGITLRSLRYRMSKMGLGPADKD
jgi:two-component system response regulator PilR (NtrC family)